MLHKSCTLPPGQILVAEWSCSLNCWQRFVTGCAFFGICKHIQYIYVATNQAGVPNHAEECDPQEELVEFKPKLVQPSTNSKENWSCQKFMKVPCLRGDTVGIQTASKCWRKTQEQTQSPALHLPHPISICFEILWAHTAFDVHISSQREQTLGNVDGLWLVFDKLSVRTLSDFGHIGRRTCGFSWIFFNSRIWGTSASAFRASYGEASENTKAKIFK